MASNSEYEQIRCFDDEYHKRFTKDGKNFVTIRDGFSGFCTFIPMPFPSSNKNAVYAKVEVFENKIYDAETQWEEEYNRLLNKAIEAYNNIKI